MTNTKDQQTPPDEERCDRKQSWAHPTDVAGGHICFTTLAVNM